MPGPANPGTFPAMKGKRNDHLEPLSGLLPRKKHKLSLFPRKCLNQANHFFPQAQHQLSETEAHYFHLSVFGTLPSQTPGT